jgi:hypothetical protein
MISLDRNFLHAAAIAFTHPATGEPLSFKASLPDELELFLGNIGAEPVIRRRDD